jgi:hypothetical protein
MHTVRRNAQGFISTHVESVSALPMLQRCHIVHMTVPARCTVSPLGQEYLAVVFSPRPGRSARMWQALVITQDADVLAFRRRAARSGGPRCYGSSPIDMFLVSIIGRIGLHPSRSLLGCLLQAYFFIHSNQSTKQVEVRKVWLGGKCRAQKADCRKSYFLLLFH